VRPADQACVHLEPETCAADYLSLTVRGANDEQADTLPGSSKIDSVTGDSLPGIGPGTHEQRVSRSTLYSSKGELNSANPTKRIWE